MLELSPDAVGSGVASAAIMTTLCALVGRYALPRWIAAREKHEEQSEVALGLLRERIDGVKADGAAQLNAMATRWHERIDGINVLVGGLSVKTARNEEDISNLGGIVRAIDGSVARLDGGMQGLTIAVQALTASIANGKKNGPA
jgi:hypothetical protein